MRLALNLTTDKNLNSITIAIPTNGADIESVQLFAVNQDSTFITDAKLEKLKAVAKANVSKTKEIQLSINMPLKAGQYYFWLTLRLKPNTDLQHQLNVTVNAIKLNNVKVVVAQPKRAISQYVAIALRQHNQENVHTHRIPGNCNSKRWQFVGCL